MTNLLSAEDRNFCTRFESSEFPAAEFHHREHLKLAYVYLTAHDTETAYKLMRGAIKSFLLYNRVDPGKYHETITRAWILAVRHFMEKTSSSDSADSFIDQNPIMLDAKIMMTHYSTGLLFSDQARGKFAAPDLDPIPRYEQ